MSGDLVQHWNSTNIHLDTKVQLMYKSRDMATKISTPFLKIPEKCTHKHTHTPTPTCTIQNMLWIIFGNVENVIKYLWSVGNSIMIISFNDFPANIHGVSWLNKISKPIKICCKYSSILLFLMLRWTFSFIIMLTRIKNKTKITAKKQI